MSNTKEIQNRINSVQDTMKITKAMYMMSSMKLRRAKQRLENTEPYFESLQEQIKDILYHFPDMQHLYFDNRAEDEKELVKRKCFLLITGDKGMAGAYNHNVLKVSQKLLDEAEAKRIFVVGEYGKHFFPAKGYAIEEDFTFPAGNPTMHRARIIAEEIIKLYDDEEIDEVYVVYTRMLNGIKEETKVEKILPLMTHKFIRSEVLQRRLDELIDRSQSEMEEDDMEWMFLPSPSAVLEKIVMNYVIGFIYGALVESYASEENSRMMAMQSATDNAEAILHDLSVEYNRVRQAAITQEITEVIGGAKALKKKKEKKQKQLLGEVN